MFSSYTVLYLVRHDSSFGPACCGARLPRMAATQVYYLISSCFLITLTPEDGCCFALRDLWDQPGVATA